MNKSQKILLLAIFMFIIQITPVKAAKELICIYKGGLQSPSTMLIQNSEGKIIVRTNGDNSLDKNDNDWWDPTSSGNVTTFSWDSASRNSNELTDCPKYTRHQYKWDGSNNNYLYTFYFYDNKTWNHFDYSLDKKYEESFDAGNYGQSFNEDYTEEIANSKWIGTCEYEDVTIYFNENKMILKNESNIVSSTKSAFSYNDFINKYKANGTCPNVYSQSQCFSNIGNTFCNNVYYLTNTNSSNKQTLNNSNIDDYLGLYNSSSDKSQVNSETCQTLLGDVDTKGSPAYYLHIVFNVLKYVAIILLVLLTIMDMVSAVASHDDDLIKKNVNKMIKRLAFCVVIFLLPTLIEFVLQFITVGEDGTIQLSTCYIGR